MKPDEYYQKQIDHYTARLKQIKKRRNLITLAKLLTFGYMIFLIYLLINHSTQPLLLLGIGAILVFIFLTLWDSQIIYRQHLIEELLRINTLESDYLAGNFSALDQGERFNDPAHPYAHDLDLFGEDSLFQHLNRTVTFSGTQSWYPGYYLSAKTRKSFIPVSKRQKNYAPNRNGVNTFVLPEHSIRPKPSMRSF